MVTMATTTGEVNHSLIWVLIYVNYQQKQVSN